MLFFGARTKEELPYFGPLLNLPKDFIDRNFAFRERRASPSATCRTGCANAPPTLAELLKDGNTCVYVCGLKSMEEGVLLARDGSRSNRPGLGHARRGAEGRRPAAPRDLLSAPGPGCASLHPACVAPGVMET